jgi:penicillin-binding protein 1B
MTNLMEDVIARGTGRAVRARGIKGAVAGKTGTSRDGWFVGYTPNLVCVVWVGFDDNSQLGLTGADSALPIWAEFMKQALAYRPDLGGERFEAPAGISKATVCSVSGARPGGYCPATYDEIFLAGTEPTNTCSVHVAELEVAPLFDEYGNPIDPAAASEPGTEPVDMGAVTPEEEAEGEPEESYPPPFKPAPPANRAVPKPRAIPLPPAENERPPH